MAKRKYKYMVEPDEKLVKKKRIVKELIIWIVEILLVLGAAWYISFYMLEKTSVIGDSMSPTLMEGDKILINRFSYRFRAPERFDVIVYKQSNKEHSYYEVKRVIGLPGDTVKISEAGLVSVNGRQLSEPVVVEPMNNSGLAEEGVSLDEGEYFVLGDNRNQSEDSRFANVGNIIADDIIGKAWIRLEPFNFISELNLLRDAVPAEEGTEETNQIEKEE